MNKRFYFLCSSLFVLSMWAQEPLENELARQVKALSAELKENPQAAAEGFENLLKGKNKKNISLLVAIGEAYLDAGNTAEAKKYAQRAMGVDNKSPEVYLLSGDIALSENDPGTACGNYEQAILFDENCTEAYYKYAHAYVGVNPQQSVDMLERLKEKHPEDIQVDRELANVYYQMGNYAQAKKLFDSFMRSGRPDIQDYGRYAMLLYLNKNYSESLAVVEKGLELNRNNHLLMRLKMYDSYELEAYGNGLEAARQFFDQGDSDSFVYLDYLYGARLYAADKQMDMAFKLYDQALKADMEGEHPEIYKEIAETCEKAHLYPQAIEAFRHFSDSLNGKLEVADLFLFGRLYYLAASVSDAGETKTEYMNKADEIFAQVAERVPTNYLGNFWRARVNSMMDPETVQGLAKPYYEKALSIFQQQSNPSPSMVIECESYLGYYYFVNNDYEQSKVHWNNILKLDPDHETAKQALAGLSAKAAK